MHDEGLPMIEGTKQVKSLRKDKLTMLLPLINRRLQSSKWTPRLVTADSLEPPKKKEIE